MSDTPKWSLWIDDPNGSHLASVSEVVALLQEQNVGEVRRGLWDWHGYRAGTFLVVPLDPKESE